MNSLKAFNTSPISRVALSRAKAALLADRKDELKAWQQQAGGFFAWGVRGGKQRMTMWNSLASDDCVLGFFDFRYQTISRLIGKVQSPEFGESLWGKPKEGPAWNSILFLSKPRQITVPAKDLQPYLCSTYRGATRIASQRINSIVRDFGSLEAFVSKFFGQY